MPEDSPAWSLYLLRCADGSIYTGITTDVFRRISEHQSGKRGSKCLRGRRPLELLYQRRIGSRSETSRLEYRIKSLSRTDKDNTAGVNALVDDFLSSLKHA